jgi:hypothetical protein
MYISDCKHKKDKLVPVHKHQAVKTYKRLAIEPRAFTALATERDEWWVWYAYRLIAGESAPGTHCIGVNIPDSTG